MNQVNCPVCGNKCVKSGRTKAGTQRWLCKKCRSSLTHKIDNTSKELQIFLEWLFGKQARSEMHFIFSSIILKDVKKYSVNTQAKYFYVEHKSAVTKNETYSVVSEKISDMKIAFSYVEAFLKENLAYRQFWDDFVEWKSRYGRYWMRNIQKMKLQQKEKQILIDSLKQIAGENIADVNAADIFYYEKSDILG